MSIIEGDAIQLVRIQTVSASDIYTDYPLFTE